MRPHSLAAIFGTLAGCLAWYLAVTDPEQCFAQFNRSSRTTSTGSSLSSMAMRSASSQGLFGTRTFGQGMSARTGSSSGLGLSSGGMGLSSAFSSRLGTQQGRQTQAGRQQGQFVGADRADVRNLLGFVTNPNQATQAWRQGLSSLRSNFGQQPNQPGQQGNGGPFGRGGGRSGQAASVPAVLEIGFEPATAATPAVTTNLQNRFQKAGIASQGENIQVILEGETVILRGTVTSSHEKLLAENLARLEPGVRRVQNELTVSPGDSSMPSRQ